MRVLIACEESQRVALEFRKMGHEAYSCDLEEAGGGHDLMHLNVDALQMLKLKWDLVIAHPPSSSSWRSPSAMRRTSQSRTPSAA